VTNVSGQTQTATLALQGPPQVSALLFAASGTASVSLGPGASSAVSVTTSSSTAGRGSGTIRLSLGGSTWLYREYSLSLDAAPSTPASLSATAISGGRIALSWAPSATTANLAGYDLWRSSGEPWAKVNGSLLTGTSYTDAATANGTTYSYKVRAVSSDAVALESVDSMIAIASADATPPTLPSAVQLVNGGGQGNQCVNFGNRTNLSVSVTLPATSLSSDVVTVSLSNGASSVTKTALQPAARGR
jgi:hypothetical protein